MGLKLNPGRGKDLKIWKFGDLEMRLAILPLLRKKLRIKDRLIDLNHRLDIKKTLPFLNLQISKFPNRIVFFAPCPRTVYITGKKRAVRSRNCSKTSWQEQIKTRF